MIGKTISHYRIEAKLGEGGMGVVYRARDLELNRNAAIKFLSEKVANESTRRRFQQEALTASSLNHPHILTVYEAGTSEGRQYLITEFIDGYTLNDWARREHPSVQQVVAIAIGIADALACAHEAGIVHRDVKPENILISKRGHPKLVDFGLAKVIEPAADSEAATRTLAANTRAGVVIGTIPYMSPEHISGKPVDARSDIFSFGAVFYEVLAGSRPFAGKSDSEVVLAILHRPALPLTELRPEIPYGLQAVIEKSLEKDAEDRYQSMREVVVDLRRSQRSRSSEAPRVGLPARSIATRRLAFAVMVESVILAALSIGGWLLYRADFFWQNPLANAQFTRLTDFEGAELDASISGDGKFVVFLADREGVFDAWLSQIGSGDFVNLTKGRISDLLNPLVRNTGFSGDASHVWLRISGKLAVGKRVEENVSLIPTLGGNARPFLEGAVMAAWSPDGNKIAYHEASPGDPIFLADRNGSDAHRIFIDKPGVHCHFLVWSPDGRFLYFARGFPPSQMDIWRIRSTGGTSERITHHNSTVSYPAFVDSRTLLYTATAEDGSGPWLYSVDVERRLSHRLNVGVEQYLSIAASAYGANQRRRLVATVSNPTATLWSVPISDRIADDSAASRFPVPTAWAVEPRYGPDYLLYLASTGGAPGLWRLKDGIPSELWRPEDGAITAAPAISPDGRQICFSVRRQGRNMLYVMTSQGTNARPVSEVFNVRGAPSWSPDSKWIAVTAGNDNMLYKVPVEGGAPVRLSDQFSSNPLWYADGSFILYAGAQLGRSVALKAVTPDGKPYPLPELWVYRFDESCRFIPGRKAIVMMQGQFRHKNFWMLDLTTGNLRQLTNLKPGFSVKNFDISPDGKLILFDRLHENSDLVLIDLPTR